MTRVNKSIRIHAPIDRVFAYLTQPENLPEIWPSMIEVMNVKNNPIGGYDFEWKYKMAGFTFEGATRTTEFEYCKKLVTDSIRGIHTHFEWIYSTRREMTMVELSIEYTIPVPILQKQTDSFVTKLNEREAETLLLNLKVLMEEKGFQLE